MAFLRARGDHGAAKSRVAFAAGSQAQSLDDAASADFTSALSDMGLTHATMWRLSAALYGVGGTLAIAMGAFLPDVATRSVLYLGCAAIGVSLFCIYAAAKLGGSHWAVHARLILGVVIFVSAAIMLGPKAAAFAMFPLLTIPTPCYLSPARTAFAYVAVTMALVFIALMTIDGPARVARALVSSLAIGMISVAIYSMRTTMRSLARYNRGLAYCDPLTGIANLRRLRELMAAEFARSPNPDAPLFALFAVDLDNFKEVNDRFDHSRGDRVLQAVAVEICGELGYGDIAARRGGDEFTVLVTRPAGRDLDGLQRRLAGAIRRARIATCPEITPSGSVAYVRARHGEDSGIVIERADAALLEAKKLARDERVGTVSRLKAHHEPLTESDAAQEDASGALTTARPPDQNWSAAATQLGPIALLLAILAATGLVEPLSPAAGIGVALAVWALTAVCYLAGTRHAGRRWLHAVWLAAYGLIALAVVLAGDAGTALVGLIPVMVMYGFLNFKARTAVVYLVAGQSLFAFLAIGGGFANATARAVITTVIVAVVGGVIGKLRVLTVHFMRVHRELSERDALTGVANLRALHVRLADLAERRASRKPHPTILAIDLDWFKQVNDKYSHSTGDRVLVAVARAIAENARVEDLVARRGGDEFFVVLDEADQDFVDAIVARLRESIARARTRICPDIVATASVAAVECFPGEGPDEVMHRADLALHDEKARSRAARRHAATA